jgi:hypothetical protein
MLWLCLRAAAREGLAPATTLAGLRRRGQSAPRLREHDCVTCATPILSLIAASATQMHSSVSAGGAASLTVHLHLGETPPTPMPRLESPSASYPGTTVAGRLIESIGGGASSPGAGSKSAPCPDMTAAAFPCHRVATPRVDLEPARPVRLSPGICCAEQTGCGHSGRASERT